MRVRICWRRRRCIGQRESERSTKAGRQTRRRKSIETDGTTSGHGAQLLGGGALAAEGVSPNALPTVRAVLT
jgi:hypothetical protein